jgi:hypothetical protein
MEKATLMGRSRCAWEVVRQGRLGVHQKQTPHRKRDKPRANADMKSFRE